MDESEFIPTQTSYLPSMWAAIASVGWYLLGGVVVLFFASPYLEEKYQNWRKKKDDEEYAKKYKKNPDLEGKRLMQIEAARQRMQAKYSETVEEVARRKEEEKAEKLRELMRFKDGAGGYRLGGDESGQSSSKKKLSDYNPLMGDSSGGYKPPKRSACRGGGCGGS